MMLWVGMISISMTFAGLTSAYVVSSSRADWLDPNFIFQVHLQSVLFNCSKQFDVLFSCQNY